MKNIFWILLIPVLTAAGPTKVGADPTAPEQEYGPGFFESEIDTTQEDYEGGETNRELPNPDDPAVIETLRRRNAIEALIRFPQTQWNECSDRVTGNYADARCAKARGISVILDEYLQNRLISCVDAGLAAQGGGTAEAIHIQHAGITADVNHSPRSLHAVNRAIDVKSIKVQLTNDTDKEFKYSLMSNRPFYKAMRTCWGKVVNQVNGCPLYQGSAMLTASIGWENSDHGRHMHLSVPYCVGGNYGSYYWIK